MDNNQFPESQSVGITSISALLIQKDIGYIQKDITSIKTAIDQLQGVYVTQNSYDEEQKALDKRLTSLEKSSALWKWLSPTTAAIAAVIIEYLFLFYLQHTR